METSWHSYCVIGMHLESQFELQLPIWDRSERPMVLLQRHAIVCSFGEKYHTLGQLRYTIDAGKNRLYGELGTTIRFLIDSCNHIDIDHKSSCSTQLLNAVVVGIILPLFMKMTNHLSFHGSAVSFDSTHGIMILGAQGSGKSTVAAYLSSRGHFLLSDDVVPVCPGDGKPLILPGMAMAKLLPDSLKYFSLNLEHMYDRYDGYEKYTYDTSRVHEPVPLEMVVVLSVEQDLDTIEESPVEGMEKIRILCMHVAMIKGFETPSSIFSEITDNFGNCRLWSLRRSSSESTPKEVSEKICHLMGR